MDKYQLNRMAKETPTTYYYELRKMSKEIGVPIPDALEADIENYLGELYDMDLEDGNIDVLDNISIFSYLVDDYHLQLFFTYAANNLPAKISDGSEQLTLF